MTDNRNRTATNIRTAFSKNGGNLAASGAVSHGFDRKGLIEYPASAGDEEDRADGGDGSGRGRYRIGRRRACDLDESDALHQVAGDLEKVLGAADGVKLAWKPSLTVAMDEKDAGTLMKLVDALDDDDDVQTVLGN